jgi:hypothetical protein
METIGVRRAFEDDLDILSDLNRQLIEDQKYDESKDVEWLRSRMKSFLATDSDAYLFEVEGRIIGYSLVSRENDPLEIKQLFIIPEERGHGYGYYTAFMLQKATNAISLDVDALVWRAVAGAM